MSLKDRETDTPVAARPACGIRTVFNNLDAEDTDTLAEWLDNDNMQHARIGTLLRADGHKISDLVVARHRNQKCSCDTRS